MRRGGVGKNRYGLRPERKALPPAHNHIWDRNLIDFFHLVICQPECLAVIYGMSELVFVARHYHLRRKPGDIFVEMVAPTIDYQHIQAFGIFLGISYHWHVFLVVLIT